MKKRHPLEQLVLIRLREFVREPSAIFWVYGFPILLAVGLGIAFRNQPADRFFVDVQEHPMHQPWRILCAGTRSSRLKFIPPRNA